MKKNTIIILFITIMIEILIFNFDSLKSMFYEEIIVNKDELILNGVEYDAVTNKYVELSNASFISKKSSKSSIISI